MSLTTHPSLLARLSVASREGDWETFYARYAAPITSLAQKQGLDEHAARDVLQETMLMLMRKLPAFAYDPERGRFRNWLLAIVANKVREAHRRTRARRQVSLDAVNESETPQYEPAVDAVATEALEKSWRLSLLEEALHRVLDDPHTKPETVAVFRACALEDRPVAEVAAQFAMKENAVYQIKNRLLGRLRSLLAELEDGAEPPPGIMNHEDFSATDLADAEKTRLRRPTQETDPLREQLAWASQLLGELPAFPTVPSLVFRRSGHARAEAMAIGSGITVGRGEGCEVRFEGREELSRRHLTVRQQQEYYMAEDLGSSNGTQIQGVPSPLGQRELRDGDLICAGGIVFLFLRGE